WRRTCAPVSRHDREPDKVAAKSAAGLRPAALLHSRLHEPCTVGERGLEPPRIAPLVPKTSAATITPLAHGAYFAKRALHARPDTEGVGPRACPPNIALL